MVFWKWSEDGRAVEISGIEPREGSAPQTFTLADVDRDAAAAYSEALMEASEVFGILQKAKAAWESGGAGDYANCIPTLKALVRETALAEIGLMQQAKHISNYFQPEGIHTRFHGATNLLRKFIYEALDRMMETAKA